MSLRATSSGAAHRIVPTTFLLLGLLQLISPRAALALDEPGSLFGPIYPRTDLAAGYAVDLDWPTTDAGAGHAWGAMSGIAVDSEDRIWTLNRGEPPVQVFDRAGTRLAAWGTGRFGTPHQIRLDPEGNVWITDSGRHVVEKFNPAGELLLTLGTPGDSGDDSTRFDGPTDVAFGLDGSISVSDGYGNNRVVQYDREGRFLRTWGRLGSGPGEFSLPHSIATDSTGRLYVADRNNARIQVFDPQGRYLDEWRNLMVPWTLWVTPADEIFACGSSPMRWGGRLPVPGVVLGVPPKDQIVMVFEPSGRPTRLWSFPRGSGPDCHPGELDWVHAIAVDSRGDLYLGDIQGRRAQRFLHLPADSPRPRAGDLAGEAAPRDEAVRKASGPERP